MIFGKLILLKIIKIVANRCHILKQKCTKFDFGRLVETHLYKAVVLSKLL